MSSLRRNVREYLSNSRVRSSRDTDWAASLICLPSTNVTSTLASLPPCTTGSILMVSLVNWDRKSRADVEPLLKGLNLTVTVEKYLVIMVLQMETTIKVNDYGKWIRIFVTSTGNQRLGTLVYGLPSRYGILSSVLLREQASEELCENLVKARPSSTANRSQSCFRAA